jgi:hypothetical protein
MKNKIIRNKLPILASKFLSSVAPALLFALLLLWLRAPTVKAQDCFYNACAIGPICDLGEQYYSPGDYVINRSLEFPVAEDKYIPQKYYDEYRDFTCAYEICNSDYPSPLNPGIGEASWWCASDIDDEEAAIRRCPNFPIPSCNLSNCQESPSEGTYCEIGSVRFCDTLYMWGYHTCRGRGWVPGGSAKTGNCFDEYLARFMKCMNGSFGRPGSGYWRLFSRNQYTEEVGRCEDLYADIKAAFTPGHVLTYTPYLHSIWQNTVRRIQAIFTPFRTEKKGSGYWETYSTDQIFDWPGESTITYSFTDYDGTGYAEAGYPPTIVPGSAAKIYFRYLGFIHCAKENLLQKLSSIIKTDYPYVYYDARCDEGLW